MTRRWEVGLTQTLIRCVVRVREVEDTEIETKSLKHEEQGK